MSATALKGVGRVEEGELAQLGERLVCIQEVTGSSPVFSTSLGSLLGATADDLEFTARTARRADAEWGIWGPAERLRWGSGSEAPRLIFDN